MSIWKSPVFYFGLLLLIAVGGALAAPFIVDWNRYKTDLQSYGERLTGRAVEIKGPVSVRLFPFPRLQADNVVVANSDMPGGDAFITADQLVVRMALDGLFAGELRVEEIIVEKPVVALERGRNGEGNWTLEPQEELRKSGLLDKVRLDKIIVHDGTFLFVDRGKNAEMSIREFNGTFSAPNIQGPWRAAGRGSVASQIVDLQFTTSSYVKGQPLRAGFKILPTNPSLPVFSFDGQIAEDGNNWQSQAGSGCGRPRQEE